VKIYAVRDRLIDYFLTPFAALSDKSVLASISQVINNPETMDAIAQAPHHFEIWILGEVQENGQLTGAPNLLCDCASLVRRGVRTAEERGAGADRRPDRVREEGAGPAPSHATAANGATAHQVDGQEVKALKTPQGPPGVPRDT